MLYSLEEEEGGWLTVNKFGSKKGRTEEEGLLSQARALICPEKCLREGMLFGVGLIHASDFGIGAGAMQLTVRF